MALELLKSLYRRTLKAVGTKASRAVSQSFEGTKPRRKPTTRRAVNRTEIVSCVTDNFIALGAVWLQSLIETKSIPENCDIVLLTDPVYAPLNEKNRALLRKIYPDLIFDVTDTAFLSDDLVQRWVDGTAVRVELDARLPMKKSVYLKLSILRMTQYSTLLWMDSDMMVVRPIVELFSLPAALAVVSGDISREYSGLSFGRSGKSFNSGLMLLREKHISDDAFNRAVDLLGQKKYTAVQDQSLLNQLWKSEEKLFLPACYNWKLGGREEAPSFGARTLRSARVVHFVGASKWALLNNRETPVGAHFMKLLGKTGAPSIIRKT